MYIKKYDLYATVYDRLYYMYLVECLCCWFWRTTLEPFSPEKEIAMSFLVGQLNTGMVNQVWHIESLEKSQLLFSRIVLQHLPKNSTWRMIRLAPIRVLTTKNGARAAESTMFFMVLPLSPSTRPTSRLWQPVFNRNVLEHPWTKWLFFWLIMFHY